jgi:streptogramin lyase
VVTGVAFAATQGVPFDGEVAQLTDAVATDPPGSLLASIDWGDGSPPSEGMLSGGNGAFAVSGTHAYVRGGPLDMTVTVASQVSGASARATFPITVAPQGAVTEFALGGTAAQPGALCAGPDGNVWFTEKESGPDGGTVEQIGRITPTGVITLFPLPGSQRLCLHSIVTGPDGNLWFSGQCGTTVGWVTPAGSFGQVALPMAAQGGSVAIATGTDADLWIATGNDLLHLTLPATLTRFAPDAGARAAALGGYGIAVGADGTVWLAGGQGVQQIKPGGSFERLLPPAELDVIQFIAAGHHDQLWFALGGSAGLALPDYGGEVTPDGQFVPFANPPSGGFPVGGIAVDPEDVMWFTVPGVSGMGSEVGRVTAAGTRTDFLLPAPADPHAITVGPDGNLWFADVGGGKIGRMSR